MFYFDYSLLIGSFLDVFMMSEARCQCELLVRLGIRVKDLYIKKCLLSSAPEISGCDVESCFVLLVGCGMVHHFAIERLKWRLEADIMANLSEKGASEIPDFIMTDGGQCSSGAT